MLRKAERCKAKCVLLFVNLWHKEGNMHSFIEYLMYLPKEKQVFIPYLNGVNMFRNANLTSNTGYTCKMLKTMRGSLASLSGYGVCLKKLLLAVFGE